MFGCGVTELNSRGIIFTLMVVFMILAVISLNTAVKQTFRESQGIEDISAFVAVGNKFKNIERQIIDLDREGNAKEMNERFLPFGYDLEKDQNSISIQQQLPAKSIVVDEFFNVVNFFAVFLNDANWGNVFDGLPVQAGTLKNPAWGGDSNALHFLIEPLCFEYTLKGIDTMVFADSNSEKCAGEFEQSDIRRFDLNIAISNPSEDFNALYCNDNPACPQQAFNPEHPQNWPYYRIFVDDSNCTNCLLSQKVASAHFDPNQDFNVMVSCVGAGCASSPIIITQAGLDFNVFRNSAYRLNISAKITFSRNIEQFLFSDFNVSVRHPTTNASKSNT